MNKQNKMCPVVELKFSTIGYTQTYLLLGAKHRLTCHTWHIWFAFEKCMFGPEVDGICTETCCPVSTWLTGTCCCVAVVIN